MRFSLNLWDGWWNKCQNHSRSVGAMGSEQSHTYSDHFHIFICFALTPCGSCKRQGGGWGRFECSFGCGREMIVTDHTMSVCFGSCLSHKSSSVHVARAELRKLARSATSYFEVHYFLQKRWVTLTSCFSEKPQSLAAPLYGDKTISWHRHQLMSREKAKTNTCKRC